MKSVIDQISISGEAMDLGLSPFIYCQVRHEFYTGVCAKIRVPVWDQVFYPIWCRIRDRNDENTQTRD